MSFYINVDIYFPSMAQIFPFIQVLQGQIGTQISVRSCADFLVSLDTDPYLLKNEIEVV